MFEIDFFCPLYNSSKYLDRIFDGLKKQQNVILKTIVFSVTESSDDTIEHLKRLIKENNNLRIKYFEVKKEEFSHSLTREKAIIDYCESDRVVLLSDDVIINNENVFFELTKDLSNSIVHTFARQITTSGGIEKYTREKNYPQKSYVVSKSDIEKMQIKAFFSSDACAGYYRPIFIEIGGYDHKNIKVSEDMYYVRKALLKGYTIKYCADAIVVHSHNLSIKQIYKRYYDIGLFFKQNPEFKEYKSFDSGIKLAIYIFFKALIHLDFFTLVRWCPDMLSRYLGKKKGEK